MIISKKTLGVFNAPTFIAEETSRIPPKNKQHIRHYGLYALRTRGIWGCFQHVVRSEKKIIAIIMEQEEANRILKHLVKIGRPPPHFDPDPLN